MSIVNFDPRAVPVAQVDTHLPAIGLEQLGADALRKRFMSSTPWQPEQLTEARFLDRAPMSAAVLLPLMMHSDPTVLLTMRTSNLSTHSSQIAFPGGKVDANDADAVAAALREAKEEVGLEAEYVDVLGVLPVYKTGSMFHVTPVVALVSPECSLQPNPFEVADVFEVPLRFLMNPAHHRRHFLNWEGVRREWFSMPYQDGNTERFIWGATAGILRNLYRYLQA